MAGNEVITGNTQSQKFLARFEMVHQQIYICFLAVFVFFLLVYKTLISILEILVVFVFYSFRKVFELLSACLQRLYKRVVCKL